MIDISKFDKKFGNSEKPESKTVVIKSEPKSPSKTKMPIGYGDIKKEYRLKMRVIDWTSRDFIVFINGYLLMKTNNILLRCKVTGRTYHQIATAMDLIVDYNGFCDNAIFKDYIEYFFQNKFSFMYQKYRTFNLAWLATESFIQKFCKSYKNYKLSFADAHEVFKPVDPYYFPVKGEPNALPTYSAFIERGVEIMDRVKEKYLISEDLAAIEFGPVILYQYLKQDMSGPDAVKNIHDICRNAVRKNQISHIIRSLEKYSPYIESDLEELRDVLDYLKTIKKFKI